MNFSNLILAFLFATSCVKVGENEESSQERTFLTQKRVQFKNIKSVLSEKCLALIRCQNGSKWKQEDNRRRNVNKKKVGPFLISHILKNFLLQSFSAILMVLKSKKILTFGRNSNALSLRKLVNILEKIRKLLINLMNILTIMTIILYGELGRGGEGFKFISKEQLDRLRSTVNSGKDHKFKMANIKRIIVKSLMTFLSILTLITISDVEMMSLTIHMLLILGTIELNPGPRPVMTNLSILSFNTNGLGNPKKLKRLLDKAAPLVENGCIVLLQETHLINSDYINLIWKHKFVLNGHRTNSAGVIILFNKKYELKKTISDNEGRQLVIVLEDLESKLIIANAYFPNDHKAAINFAESFYSNILEVQSEYSDHLTLCGGDFNVCLYDEDKLNRNITPHERELAKTIIDNNKVVNLVDSFRAKHKKGGFSWMRGMIYSRLDYIFVSKEVISSLSTSTVDWAFETSDHAAVKSSFAFKEAPVRGPGIVKVNVKILANPDIAEKIGKEITEQMNQTDNLWDPHSKLEFLKVTIRSVFAENTSKIRNELREDLREREESLNQMQEVKIKLLERQKNGVKDFKMKHDSVEEAIKFLKDETANLRTKLSDTLAFAAKARWYESGEKSNKYFLNINSCREKQKLMSKIKNGPREFTGQQQVMEGVREFYEDLYNKKNSTQNPVDETFYDECPKLDEQSANLMESELKLEELKSSLLTCKDASAPGPDGIPYEVYKRYWGLMGPIILDSWYHSISTGQLPPSHLESIITLLPKEGKDSEDIKNWRPITLSNCDLKIITKSLSNKMATILDRIIDKSQTAYVPGRSVADNLRANYFLKGYCENKNIDAVLISLDAKKAFDSVDHQYIEKTLKAYGFGPNFIRIFKTLYNKITARILVNGFRSESINIKRGVKQGDALSCAIFIICIDPLLRNINKNVLIEKIDININEVHEDLNNVDYKGSAYADDISVICKDNLSSIQQVFKEYDRLSNNSGLELNADKTEILKINSKHESYITFTYCGKSFTILSVTKIKICGLYFCSDKDEEYEFNVLSKIEKLRSQIKKWSHNHLTFEGKNLVIKTFGLSQLIYNMQVCKFKLEEIKSIERTIFGFLWSTKDNPKGIDRIKRSIMKNNYSNGGLSVTDVECLDRALKLRQFIRANNSNHFISTIQDLLTKNVGKNVILKQEYINISEEEAVCNVAQTTTNILTDYLRDKYCKTFSTTQPDDYTVEEVSSINLKSYLKRKNRLFHMCFLKKLSEVNIHTLGDLMQAYEFEQSHNLNKIMKIIIKAFPPELVEITKYYKENTNCNRSFEYLMLDDRLASRIAICKVTTKNLQNVLKIAMNKVENIDFEEKLKINFFDKSSIETFRHQCKNVKLRNIFFRLIHNDFFTRVRMKKYKMVNDDACSRCCCSETSQHLLWECVESRKIWNHYNNLMVNANKADHCVKKYDDIFKISHNASFTIVKIKTIQELIQMTRPTNWLQSKYIDMIINLIKIEKYNAKTNTMVQKHNNKWHEMITALNKMQIE